MTGDYDFTTGQVVRCHRQDPQSKFCGSLLNCSRRAHAFWGHLIWLTKKPPYKTDEMYRVISRCGYEPVQHHVSRDKYPPTTTSAGPHCWCCLIVKLTTFELMEMSSAVSCSPFCLQSGNNGMGFLSFWGRFSWDRFCGPDSGKCTEFESDSATILVVPGVLLFSSRSSSPGSNAWKCEILDKTAHRLVASRHMSKL